MKRGRFVRILTIGIAMVAIGLSAGTASANHGYCVAQGGTPTLDQFGPSKADLCFFASGNGVWVGADAINTCSPPWALFGICTWGAHVSAPVSIQFFTGFGAAATTSPSLGVSPGGGTGTGETGASWARVNGGCVQDLNAYALGPHPLGDRGLC